MLRSSCLQYDVYCGRLSTKQSGFKQSWGHCFFTYCSSPTQEYTWVPASCMNNLTNYWGITCDGLASHLGQVTTLLSSSTIQAKCQGLQTVHVLDLKNWSSRKLFLIYNSFFKLTLRPDNEQLVSEMQEKMWVTDFVSEVKNVENYPISMNVLSFCYCRLWCHLLGNLDLTFTLTSAKGVDCN